MCSASSCDDNRNEKLVSWQLVVVLTLSRQRKTKKIALFYRSRRNVNEPFKKEFYARWSKFKDCNKF